MTVNIGDKPNDPVVGVSDLLIHLSGEQMGKKASEVIKGESLDVLIGSIPGPEKDEDDKDIKERVKANILTILSQEYGVDEDDFLSAEIEVVPAGEARDYGLDRSMIMGYGHDDRVCAYPSYRAMLEIEGAPEYTSVCLLVDKEEIGSVGASGMQSRFFENCVAEVMNLAGDYSELAVRRALKTQRYSHQTYQQPLTRIIHRLWKRRTRHTLERALYSTNIQAPEANQAQTMPTQSMLQGLEISWIQQMFHSRQQSLER